jgi:hypothetical protein
MQPGTDAAPAPVLTPVKLRGEHEHGIGVGDGFYAFERRPLVLCQDSLEITNRLIELLCRRQWHPGPGGLRR